MNIKAKILGCLAGVAIVATSFLPFSGTAQAAKPQEEGKVVILDADTQSTFTKLGIKASDVRLIKDYGTKAQGLNPYSRTYKDLATSQYIQIVSSLPIVDADGIKIDVGWYPDKGKYYTKNNLFNVVVYKNSTTITVKNDQPDRKKAGWSVTVSPQLFLGGVELLPISITPTLLAIDPINPNYTYNTLEWDYGIAKRRERLIEGGFQGSWVFAAKPSADIRIKYNQIGDYKLKLGQFKATDDEEVVTLAGFDQLTKLTGYPTTISDSMTFYPDANVESTSVDGMVQYSTTDATGVAWATIHDSSVGNAADGWNAFDDSSINAYVYIATDSAGVDWVRMWRVFTLFDTSGLPDGANISDATLSLYGVSKTMDFAGSTSSINIYSSSPASNTTLASEDYDQVGTTAFATAITSGNFSIVGYNDFDLNASGIASINTTGISKFSARESEHDAPNSQPGLEAGKSMLYQVYMADEGIGFQPRLVVTYTVPVVVTSFMVEGTGRNWAIVRGYIDDEGVADITTTLVEWGLTSGVYTANTTMAGTWNTGDYFTLTARSLQPATVYYWRVGIRNTGGSYYYGAERTWATEGSPSLREYLSTGQDGNSSNITGTTWWAQQFTTDALGHSATSVRVYIRRYGNPGTITLSLRHATAGLPTGLDLTSGTYNGNSLLTSYMMVEFDTTDISLEGSTQYAIVLRALAGDSSNGIYWGIDSGGGLANAVSSNSTDGGLTWSSETPKDALFEIWGEEVLEVKGGAVFSGYVATGDLLFTADMFNEYPPYYSAYDSTAYFDLRLYNTDGTTVLASTPVVDWGRRAGSIYLSADAATPLTWGSAFYLRILGSFDPTNIIASYQLTAADWVGSDLTYLDRWVITEAHLMEDYYNDTFVTEKRGREILNDEGGVWMDRGIIGLSYIRPDIFQTLEHTIPYTLPSYNNAFEGATDWETEVGTTVTNTMNSLGDLVNVDGKVALQVILVGAMIALALFTRSILFGLLLAVPIALWGTSLRVIPIQVVLLLGFIAMLVVVFKWWFSKG